MRVKNDDWRPESQESWMATTSHVETFTTQVTAGSAGYHNTCSKKPTFPIQILESRNTDNETDREQHGKYSNRRLDAMPTSDVDWDKSLPPTPVYNIPMALASAHIGEKAARTLHSKFSSHHARNKLNDYS
jgi:hypothetical protein